MRFILVWAVLLSALAASLAQPSDLMLAGSPWLALVAWVPLFWALRRSESNRSAAGLAALFGFATTVLQNYWMVYFKDYAIWAAGGVSLAVAGYFALFGPFLRTILRRKSVWRPFAVGAAWAVFEYLKSNGFLGFPWGLAPYPFHQWSWMVQIVDITGLSFLAFLVAAWNAWLAEALEKDGYFTRGGAGFFTLVTAGLALYGTVKLQETRPSRGTVDIALVQQNGDPWASGDDLGPLRTSVKHSREVLKTGRPDLIVWSEASLRLPLQYYRNYYDHTPAEAPLLRTIRASKTWWLLGNPYRPSEDRPDDWLNATVLMNPQAQIAGYYGKVQTVPFAEYVPFWEVPAVRSFFQNVVGLQGTWVRGDQWTLYEVPVKGSAGKVVLSTPICFEDAFPWLNSLQVRQGAEILVNLTNDSWSKRDSSQVQHHVAALFRTIENRVWMVRSSNGGVTSFIDPTGQVAAGPLPYFRDGHLEYQVPLPKDRVFTAYTLYGDWLLPVFWAIVLFSLVTPLPKKRE